MASDCTSSPFARAATFGFGSSTHIAICYHPRFSALLGLRETRSIARDTMAETRPLLEKAPKPSIPSPVNCFKIMPACYQPCMGLDMESIPQYDNLKGSLKGHDWTTSAVASFRPKFRT